MRPIRSLGHEFLQKQPRRDRSSKAKTFSDIAEIRDGAAQVLGIGQVQADLGQSGSPTSCPACASAVDSPLSRAITGGRSGPSATRADPVEGPQNRGSGPDPARPHRSDSPIAPAALPRPCRRLRPSAPCASAARPAGGTIRPEPPHSSTAPITTSRFRSVPSSSSVLASPSATAAPPISFFMLRMDERGLISSPPVSNTTPLPTSATVGADREPLNRSIRIRGARAGVAPRLHRVGRWKTLPRAWHRQPPGSNRPPCCSASAFAASASSAGPISSAGAFTSRRAMTAPSSQAEVSTRSAALGQTSTAGASPCGAPALRPATDDNDAPASPAPSGFVTAVGALAQRPAEAGPGRRAAAEAPPHLRARNDRAAAWPAGGQAASCHRRDWSGRSTPASRAPSSPGTGSSSPAPSRSAP